MSTQDARVEDDIAKVVATLTALARRTEVAPGQQPQRHDFAAIVTGVLASVAANVGGVDELLAGRPGSWEADGVRSLLYSTLGRDEARLWEYRTAPVEITLYVEEILTDQDTGEAYGDAAEELVRRYDAIGIPSVSGIPGDAATEAALAALEPATAEQEAAAERIGLLEARLEEQRLADWFEYGQALKAAVQDAAARLPELGVPVVVSVDLTTYRSDWSNPRVDDLAEQLVDQARAATALPGAGRPPLERLENPVGE